MLGISRQQTVRDNDFGRSVLHLKIMRRLTGIRTRGHPLLLHLSLLFHAHSFLVLARTNLSTRPTWRPEAFQSIADLLPNFPGRNARWNGRYGDCDGRLGDVGSPARMADPACMTKPKFLFCQHHQTAEGSPASLFFRPTSDVLTPPTASMRHPFQCIVHGRDPTDLTSNGFLVAACGPKLISLSLTSNEIISEWPQTQQVGVAVLIRLPPAS